MLSDIAYDMPYYGHSKIFYNKSIYVSMTVLCFSKQLLGDVNFRIMDTPGRDLSTPIVETAKQIEIFDATVYRVRRLISKGIIKNLQFL